jgi:hypothetical protein
MGKQFLPVLYAPRPIPSHVVYLLSWVLGNECNTFLDILAIGVLENICGICGGMRKK